MLVLSLLDTGPVTASHIPTKYTCVSDKFCMVIEMEICEMWDDDEAELMYKLRLVTSFVGEKNVRLNVTQELEKEPNYSFRRQKQRKVSLDKWEVFKRVK